ncbi:23S rRNA (adenine(2503)-C(2))-methyltransferase RlmN [Deltaproteobacteria bacterium TL4]
MSLNIKDLTYDELQMWMQENREQAYRAGQVFYWLYQKRVTTFEPMATLSKRLREKLENAFYISKLKRHNVLHSVDGTAKYVFELEDGNRIETVLMPHQDHYTVCVSSQVGCPMGCAFCMTAKMGFIRHLRTSEIIDQIIELWHDLPEGETLRNVVFMGMGEPFHNYNNVIRALMIMMHDHGMNFSSRRVTLSTSGLIPKIKKFATESVKANLAISLNGVTDEIRSQLMPVNNAYNLEKLIEVCKAYPLESRKRITFEYILFKGITDSLDHAKQLIKLLHGVKFKINLIPYNETPDSPFKKPAEAQVQQFQQYLLDHGVVATLRMSKGQDIQGACGQLITETSQLAVTS